MNIPNELRFDVEFHLKTRFPILFQLLGPNKINWKQVNKTFTKKFIEYKERSNRLKSTFPIQASFYHIIISAMKGEQSAQRLLDYIQLLFENLIKLLDPFEKKEITKILFGFLTNMDLKYLNFLGELSVLYLYKCNLGYALIKTEVPVLSNKKSGVKVDFKFFDPQNKTHQYIEVVNIHLDQIDTSDIKNITNFLTQKIEDKISRTLIRENTHIYLMPVIWGQYTEIKSVLNYYDTEQPVFFNTCNLTCFMTFTVGNGDKVHKFGTIQQIFEGVKFNSE